MAASLADAKLLGVRKSLDAQRIRNLGGAGAWGKGLYKSGRGGRDGKILLESHMIMPRGILELTNWRTGNTAIPSVEA